MKNIVVDFSNLDDMSGFGEIARNYAPRLAKAAKEMQDLHFVFILPEKHRGSFGAHIDYISREHLKKEAGQYKGTIHLWHATHQQFRYRLRGKDTIQLLTVHDLNYRYEKHGIHLLRHHRSSTTASPTWRICPDGSPLSSHRRTSDSSYASDRFVKRRISIPSYR